MKIIVVFLVVILTGCANTPYLANYTKSNIDQSQYVADRDQCKKKSIDDALITTNGIYFSDVYAYFVAQNMLACMRAKGYEPVGIHPNAYKQTL